MNIIANDTTITSHTHRRRFLCGAIAGTAALSIADTAKANTPRSIYSAMPKKEEALKMPVIIREFSDPLLEIVRLLQEAAEIEQDLMVQYMYAAFSLKPEYKEICGYGAPSSTDLLGVAIEEMQHLGTVNRLLTKLGCNPVLQRSDFPYENDIYPFPFLLESFSKKSLAKYMYCEAPTEIFSSSGDKALQKDALHALGDMPKPNFIGNLYERIIDLTEELQRDPTTPRLNWGKIRAELREVQEEGEDGHFSFFRTLFTGTHPVMKAAAKQAEVANIWDLPPEHAAYPSYSLPDGLTAYYSHPGGITDTKLMRVAMLGNMSYWIILLVLDMYYRGHYPNGSMVAQGVMLSATLPIASYLPAHGAALPFDPISMALHMSPDEKKNRAMTIRMIREAAALEESCAKDGLLPDMYPAGFFAELAPQVKEG